MNRRVIIAAAIASVVILLGWYFILWSPAKEDLTKAEDRTEAAEQQQRQLEQAISRLRSAQRNEPLLRAQLESLRTAIPDVPNLAQFILDTNDAAARSGIDFISIAPSEPRQAAGTTTPTTARAGTTSTTRRAGATTTTTTPRAAAPAEITIALQIQGGYFPVLDFLNRLDAMPRLVVIDSINVSVDPATTRLSVALNTRMFTRTVPPGFAGAPATTSTTAAAGGATTTTAAGGATTTSAAGGATTTTTTAGAAP